MLSNYSTIKVEADEIHTNETSHCIYLSFLQHYITLTNNCIINDTLRWQVIADQ